MATTIDIADAIHALLNHRREPNAMQDQLRETLRQYHAAQPHDFRSFVFCRVPLTEVLMAEARCLVQNARKCLTRA